MRYPARLRSHPCSDQVVCHFAIGYSVLDPCPKHDFATVGIPVHGDNHSIVRGAPSLDGWHIVRPEFRGNLEWAVVVPGDGAVSPAVARLLDELLAHGITFHDFRFGP